MKTKEIPFYKLEAPTTEQIFDAIINNEYTPLDKIAPKAKQVKVLLLDYFGGSELFVTFDSVTNTGGRPIFFNDSASFDEIAQEVIEDFYELSIDEQENEIELLSSYTHTFDSIFNL